MLIYGLLSLLGLVVIIHLIWFMIFKRTFTPVLMYHRVTGDTKKDDVRFIIHKGKRLDLDSMKVSPTNFDVQMAYLKKKGYQTLDLKKDFHKPKTVYITFDDGYEDNYLFAFNSLKKYGLKATFFITSELAIKGLFMPIDSNDKRVENRLLTTNQIREMSEAKMQIGSHTLTHPWLTHEGVNIEDEIVKSKRELEEIIGKEVTTFAYPGGLYNDKVLELVSKHYDVAVTTSLGESFRKKDETPYTIERETISSTDSLLMFKLKVWGVMKFIRKHPLIGLLKKVIKWLLRK